MGVLSQLRTLPITMRDSQESFSLDVRGKKNQFSGLLMKLQEFPALSVILPAGRTLIIFLSSFDPGPQFWGNGKITTRCLVAVIQ